MIAAVAALRDTSAFSGLFDAVSMSTRAAEGIADLGPGVLSAILRAAESPAAESRARASRVLGVMAQRKDDTRVLSGARTRIRAVLLQRAHDSNADVRGYALDALASFSDNDVRTLMHARASASCVAPRSRGCAESQAARRWLAAHVVVKR